MVGSKKLKAKPSKKSSKRTAKRSSGTVKKGPVAKRVSGGGSGSGYSMDYAIALEIQRKFSGGSPPRAGRGGEDFTSAQELNLRNRTLGKTAAATDRSHKSVSEINAPKRGGMIPARRGSGRPAATGAKKLDRQQLGLRNKTLKDTPPSTTPQNKRLQSVVAPQRGGMVPTGGRSKGKAK